MDIIDGRLSADIEEPFEASSELQEHETLKRVGHASRYH